MSRAKDLIEKLKEMEPRFEIKLTSSGSCGISLVFDTGIFISEDVQAVKRLVKPLLDEMNLEIKDFFLEGSAIVIKAANAKISEAIENVGKELEGKLKCRLKQEDLENEDNMEDDGTCPEQRNF